MTCGQKRGLDRLLELSDLPEDEVYFLDYLDLHWRKKRLSNDHEERLARIAARMGVRLT
jgi:hypothetical protein